MRPLSPFRVCVALGLYATLIAARAPAAQFPPPADAQPPAATASSGLELHPVLTRGPLRVLRVYLDGTPAPRSISAGENQNERLLYSNTMGFYAVAPGANVRIADDIVVTARDGCKLTRFSFDVAGNINGATGPYTVSYSLMNVCPGAIDASIYGHRTIPLTSGSILIPDENPTTVEVLIPDAAGTAIPTNLWLVLRFSRANAGPIVGAPAQEGYSMDLLHAQGAPPCAVNFGNFPDQLHGSFNVQMWGGTPDQACPAANLAYHAHRETGPLFNPGANVWTIDDLGLLPPECNLIGYEVTVKGAGEYNFEFRETCDGPAIAGTERLQLVASAQSSADTRNLRFIVDPPVAIPANVFFAARMNNSTARVVAAGTTPEIGQSDDTFGLLSPGETECCTTNALLGKYDTLSLTIICDGPAEAGACCDMYVPQCEGGMRDGLPCRENAHCPGPGACEAQCRELPKANCTFPPSGTSLRPHWEPGDACHPNPFADITCGQGACCQTDKLGIDTCTNLTKNQCSAQEPLDAARHWQQGRICGRLGQFCPLIGCVDADGNCAIAHPTPGCNAPECCSHICSEYDPWCCKVVWDQTCVEQALAVCILLPDNDGCATARAPSSLPITLQGAQWYAQQFDSFDPPVCCHNNHPPACNCGLGIEQGNICDSDNDCPGGTCGPRPPLALYTVWYKWVQPPNQTTMRIETCNSNTPASDGLLQAFAPSDNSTPQAACNSLIPIGCADDNCGAGGKQARLCLTHLTPGNTYYAMVGAKTEEARGDYRVSFTPGCVPPVGTLPNDWCHAATAITDGDTPFNLAQATLDCPTHECLSSSTRDIWYNYVATCTGHTLFQTCSGNPDTSLAIYAGCDHCPDETTQPIACSDGSPAICGGSGESAAVSVSLIQGTCYKIRLANDNNSSPLGQLHIFACEGIHGSVVFHDPPDGVIDAGRPHGHDSQAALGIQEIVVQGPPGVPSPLNWRVDCETAHSDGEPNEIESITETPPISGVYIIRLLRPITTNAFTAVRYLGNPVNDPASAIRMTAHPSNVNGDEIADADDILAWAAAMNVDAPGPPAPWGNYSLDIDRSGIMTPLDLLDLLDLMNGADLYEAQFHTPLPPVSPCLP